MSSSNRTNQEIKINAELFSQEQYLKLKHVVIRACENAEYIANCHKSRPCFNKIDSLCAKLKQDIIRADPVLANINSQGIAWAIKDFIFVFIRIATSWNIIKGYVYCDERLNSSVKAAISDQFVDKFLKWQEATMNFLDDLFISFQNLDQLSRCKTKASTSSIATVTASSQSKKHDSNVLVNESTEYSFKPFLSVLNITVDELSAMMADVNLDSLKIYKSQKVQAITDGSITSQSCNGKQDTNVNSIIDPYLPLHFSQPRCSEDELLLSEVALKLLQTVCNIEESNYFLMAKFLNIYFPDFLTILPNFIDINTIVNKFELGAYCHLFQIISDLRQIFGSVELYLQQRPCEFLQQTISNFELKFEILLMQIFSTSQINSLPM